jgi:hypothetical protein
MSYLIYDHHTYGLVCLELSSNETRKCLEFLGNHTPAPTRLRPMPVRKKNKNIFNELEKMAKDPDFRKPKL